MFAFEFTILFISSIATAGKYILGLTEKYILRQEAKRRRLERAAERERSRQERLATGESLADETPVAEEDDDDEWENELGGWEERAQWTFGLDLVTGKFLIRQSG
jgi:E3 ubiquitin-protein ligase synoviolin